METEKTNNTEDQTVPNSPFGFGVDGDKASTSSRKFKITTNQINTTKPTKINKMETTMRRSIKLPPHKFLNHFMDLSSFSNQNMHDSR